MKRNPKAELNKKQTPKAKLIEVSPAMAEKMLERNVHNRPLRDHVVQYYAAEMRAGHWLITDAAIGFDWDGNLVNGQHRLAGCVLAQVSFWTWVVEGLDPHSQDIIDNGVKRRPSDVLHLAGHPRASILATVARLLFYYERNRLQGSRNSQISPFDIAQVVERGGDELNDAIEWVCRNRIREIIPEGLASFCKYIFSKQNPEKAESFLLGLKSGLDLRKTDAVYWLRERMVRKRGANFVANALPYVWKAWVYHRDGVPVRYLKMQEGEEWWDIERTVGLAKVKPQAA